MVIADEKPVRPGLPKSDSAGALSSTPTVQVPAHIVFSTRGAKPLNLPHLDLHLSSIPSPTFSDPEHLVGPKERDAWDRWVRGDPYAMGGRSWWRPWRRRRLKPTAELDRIASERSQIVPPMHLIPESLTLADLKLNQHKPVPLLSLDTVVGVAIDGVLGAEGSSASLAFVEVARWRKCLRRVLFR